MPVYSYVRVSTEQQAQEGVSLAAQTTRINAWAEGQGYAVERVFQDAGISGKRTDTRPGLLAAMAVLKKGDILVVYSLSRLSRSTRDTLDLTASLEKVGANLVSLTERLDTTTASGKLIFTFFSMLSQHERDLISERTTTALRHKRETGQVYGHTPFGFKRVGDTLVVDAEEQAALMRIQELHGQGYTYNGLARLLNAQAVPTKQGGRWHAATVRGILTRNLPPANIN